MAVHKIADWAGTSERMIWDVYRKQLQEVADVRPVDLEADRPTIEVEEHHRR